MSNRDGGPYTRQAVRARWGFGFTAFHLPSLDRPDIRKDGVVMSDEIIRQFQAASDEFSDTAYVWAEYPTTGHMSSIPDRLRFDTENQGHVLLPTYYVGQDHERMVFPWLLGRPGAAERLRNIAEQMNLTVSAWCRELAETIRPERRVWCECADQIWETDGAGEPKVRAGIKQVDPTYLHRLACDGEACFSVIRNVFSASVEVLQQGQTKDANETAGKKRRHATADEMRSRNFRVTDVAVRLKQENRGALPTVRQITEITGLSDREIRQTAAYRQGHITKKNAKMTREVVKSATASEHVGKGSPEASRAKRESEESQAELDELIEQQTKDATGRRAF